MERPVFYLRRKQDGKYMRGAKLWRWTRFRCFAAKCYEPTWHFYAEYGDIDLTACDLIEV